MTSEEAALFKVVYKWKKENPDESPYECVLERYYLSSNLEGFPWASIDLISGELARKKYTKRYFTTISTIEKHDYLEDFDSYEDAKLYCEYKVLGGPKPDFLKLQEVEEALDGV